MYLVCTRDGSHNQHFAVCPGQDGGHTSEQNARAEAMKLSALHPGKRFTVIRVVAAYVADQVREVEP